ncbi:MAG: SMC-Scp complex subunit ScpB [Phycisphaerae bacterium]
MEQDIKNRENNNPLESETQNSERETGFSEPETQNPKLETGISRDQIVEAILFASDTPLPASKIASVVGAISSREIREIIENLNENYNRVNCAFHIQEIAGGFQMMTRPEFSTYLQQLYKVRSESKLSAAALETLAIIAYKQPVLRAEIEAIRGVACGEMIRSLMEKDLIKIVGRAEELGRPMLYGTTKKFMQVFGLASLEDLPKVPELLPPNRPTPVQQNIDEIKTSQEPAPAETNSDPQKPVDAED